jgi:hypothetical protein
VEQNIAPAADANTFATPHGQMIEKREYVCCRFIVPEGPGKGARPSMATHIRDDKLEV